MSEADFQRIALGEIAYLEMGQSPDSRYVFDDPFVGYPFLQGNAEFGAVFPEPEFGCTKPAKMCRTGDVLISVRAPVGAVNIANRDYCIGRGLAAIRAPNIKSSLMGELIARQSSELRRVAQGTTFEAINKKDLHSLVLNIPPNDDLPVVAQILDVLDAAIAQTEAIIAKLKAVKQGLLHDLLTRGIDANGELRPPYSEAPQLYKQSALGWIPKEWSVCNVSDVGEVRTGRTPPGSDQSAWGTSLPFITPGDIQADQRVTEAERYISERGAKYVQVLPGGSVVVVCIGSTIGKVGITTVDSCTNQQINAVIPNHGIDREFLFFALCLHANQMRWMAGLQAVPIVKKSAFETIKVPIPSLEEQQAIAAGATCLDMRIEGEMSALGKLKKEKIGLIDDLLTGRVRVTPLLDATTA